MIRTCRRAPQGLLEFLHTNGHEDQVEAFFEQYWEERIREVEHHLARVPQDDRDGRMAVVMENLKEQGFMPEADSAGAVTIRACNCPFPEAVKRTTLPCRLESQFFERVFGGSVKRSTYIPDGVAACTYEISPSTNSGRAPLG